MAELKFGDELKAQPDYFAQGQTVPQNDNADAERGAQLVGGAHGALEIVTKVSTDIVLADTTTITIDFLAADTEDGTYASIEKKVITASGATTLAVGEELLRYCPDSKDPVWFKVNVTTTDAAAVGAYDAYIAHKGR